MRRLVIALFIFLSFSVSAQSIFHYGDDSVQVAEFLRAWKKNNSNTRTEKAFREYLDLYIASRLKIREAKAMGLDTLPQLVADLENLRQQIIPSYLNDKTSVDKLVEEAFLRSQKDINLSHIFISFLKDGTTDSSSASAKLTEVLSKLKSNLSFEEVARTYSDDPAVKINGGHLGWIGVFTLPYELENLAYSTPAGKVSAPYRSASGYHIFKNLGDRKDPGRMKAAQILLAFPPGADEHTKQQIRHLADSLYNLIVKGQDFGTLAGTYSNDIVSAAANGQMQEFGIGQFDPVFENAVFGIQKDGAVLPPFSTAHGYHIVKRLSRIPPITNRKDAKAMDALRERVEQSDRIETTRSAVAKKVLNTTAFNLQSFSFPELWAFSDSLLVYRTGGGPIRLTNASTLFEIGKMKVTAGDWISFAQTARFRRDGTGTKAYTQVWDEFLEAQAVKYYERHLEDYNEEFRQQVNEFREGNLFFEIMQRKVWGPAQTDSAALVEFYNRHQSNYMWKQSADAVIFYVGDAGYAKEFRDQLKKSPATWKEFVTSYSEKIAADSARFELGQIPNPANEAIRAGVITTPFINPSDNTASFAYIIRTYTGTAPRSFPEARGLVINDYQAALEKQWINELKRKYPVRVNEKLLNSLIKAKKY